MHVIKKKRNKINRNGYEKWAKRCFAKIARELTSTESGPFCGVPCRTLPVAVREQEPNNLTRSPERIEYRNIRGGILKEKKSDKRESTTKQKHTLSRTESRSFHFGNRPKRAISRETTGTLENTIDESVNRKCVNRWTENHFEFVPAIFRNYFKFVFTILYIGGLCRTTVKFWQCT